jgi:hypothetical protein
MYASACPLRSFTMKQARPWRSSGIREELLELERDRAGMATTPAATIKVISAAEGPAYISFYPAAAVAHGDREGPAFWNKGRIAVNYWMSNAKLP